MIYEYEYIITVEIDADNREEEIELKKRFKKELFASYGGNEETRITEIKER